MNDHLYTTTIYSWALKVLVKSGSCLTDDVSSICQQKHVHKHTMGWFFIVLCPNALPFMQEFGSSLDEQKSGSDILWPVWFIRHGKLSVQLFESQSSMLPNVQLTCLVVSHLMISHQNHLLIMVSTHQANCFLIRVTIQENTHNIFFSLLLLLSYK